MIHAWLEGGRSVSMDDEVHSALTGTGKMCLPSGFVVQDFCEWHLAFVFSLVFFFFTGLVIDVLSFLIL